VDSHNYLKSHELASGTEPMRDDLLDAQSSVDWAISQIPIFQEKIASWNAKRPYEIMVEIDPQTSDYLLVAYSMGPLDPIVNAELGVIINSARTALDLLAASLCRRNGNKPSADTHFPIFASEQCMIDPLTGIEGKKWLSRGERASIKDLKPYKGGDHTIWPLHQLDVLRKHTRLVSARPDVSGFRFESGTPGGEQGYMMISGLRGIERLEDKTILARIGGTTAPRFDMTHGNAHVAAHITFDEADIGITDEEVATTLLRFAGRVTEIIKLFDTR
jgi:hypothetical protein